MVQKTKNRKCQKCLERDVHIKKWSLCNKCYADAWRSGRLHSKGFIPKTKTNEAKLTHFREMEFIKNFFTHTNWIYEPAAFHIGEDRYTPDFYDGERNIFIEVVGSRQAFHSNKLKYEAFKKKFPKIKLELRAPNGALIEEEDLPPYKDSHRVDWEYYNL